MDDCTWAGIMHTVYCTSMIMYDKNLMHEQDYLAILYLLALLLRHAQHVSVYNKGSQIITFQ
jgi:hypothetical protein